MAWPPKRADQARARAWRPGRGSRAGAARDRAPRAAQHRGPPSSPRAKQITGRCRRSLSREARMPTTPWCQAGSKKAQPLSSADASSDGERLLAASPLRCCAARAFSRSSCCAQFAARASSSVTRHSMPRLMSASRPAALRRGPGDEAQIEARRLGQRAPGHAQQRGDARLRAPGAHALEALRHQHAVVRVERHDVGDRAQRDQVRQRAEVGLLLSLERASSPQFRAQGQHDVEHDPDAGQRLGGKAAARLVGVDDAGGLGQLCAGQVVVGDQRLRCPARWRAPRLRRWRCRCRR